MAIKSSFKQQCPSCEAMVPIRDPGLIGRKIDCPKCKYRFVVEEPAEEADEEATKTKSGITAKKPANGKAGPARRGEDKEDEFDGKPKAKKSGGSAMLIVGLGLAAVAVVALAVGGWLLFGGDSDSSSDSSSGTRASSSSSASKSSEAKQDNTKGGGQPRGEAKPNLPDATNLLPNETEIVLSLPVERLLSNAAFKKAVLQTPGSFNSGAFQRTWGIPATEITQVVMSLNTHKKAWFSVMRLNKPVKEDQVVAGLKLKAEPPVGGMKYYLLKKPLDSLSTALLKGGQPGDKFALHFVDNYTVVCADTEPMKQFLNEKGRPKHLSEGPGAAPAEQPEQAAPSGGPPGGMRGMMPPGGGMRGMSGPPQSGSGGPPSGRPGAPPGGAASGPPRQGPSTGMSGGPPAGYQPPGGLPGMPGMNRGSGASGSGAAEASSSYLTIHPDLKAVLDQVEKPDKKEATALFSAAALVKLPSVDDLQKLIAEPQIPSVVYSMFLAKMGMDLRDIRSVGLALTELSDTKVSAAVAVAAKDERVAQSAEKEIATQLPKLVTLTGRDIIAKTGGNAANGVAGMNPGAGMQGMGMMMMMRGGRGGMPPPGVGGVGMMPPGGGSGMMPPGRGGMMPPGRGGMMPPGAGGFQGGVGPGGMQPGGTDQPKELTGKDGEYDLWSINQVVALGVTLNIKEEIYAAATKALEEGFTLLKGVAEMSDNHSRIHELAAALQAYVKDKGQFPRGAKSAPPSADRVIDWRPDQRMSWMVELLPYVAGGEFKNLPVDNEKSWNEPPVNVLTATTVIPQYVTPLPKDKQFEFYINYPGLKGFPLGATHFVGIAGVGLDAAEYRSDDPATAKLRGIFGYDRVTKPAEIKDGLANTIAVLQVPPDHKSPWIAGGGSTVRGVSEDLDCVKPFVCTEYQGKRGTFALMADGKVRFIPSNIDPKTFQAMCTIAGGEKINNLDKVAPEVPPPDEEEQPELKANAVAPPTAPAKPQPQPAPPTTGGAALRTNQLKQIGLAYHNYVDTHKKPPAKIEDLAPFYENDAKITALVKDGTFVVIWNSSFQHMTAGTSNTVLAYEKDAKDKGGLVLMADGSVKTMTAKEFNAATKASGQ